jgi:DNA-binding transcriptional LysR family regulator
MIVQFALRNLGIGCVVEDFAKKQLENGELFSLEFESPIPEREMCLIVDKQATLSVAAARLKELLKVETTID